MRKPGPNIPALIMATFLALCVDVCARDDQSPTTQPTTSKTDGGLARQFNLLFDADPRVRDRAKTDLMGSEVGDLEVLKRLVKEKSPLPPDVLAAVHEVVIQVFLAHEKYTDIHQQQVDASSRTGPFFLGITWPNGVPEDGRLGMTIDERLPGFPSYRFLRKGDLVLDVTLHTGMVPNPTHNVDDLKSAIRMAPGVQDIVLTVVRNGEQITIPITMAPRPIESGSPDEIQQQQQLQLMNTPQSIEMFKSMRIRSAGDYWHANFEPEQSVRVGE